MSRIVAGALSIMLLLVFLSTVQAQEPETPKKRKPHPLAPSLPLLTNAERDQIDIIINRFILYDSGKLPGADGKKILADFDALGPAAIFRLIRGLNKAANLKASCPAVVIGKKVRRLLNSSQDVLLLDFARDTIGSGVTARRHMGVIRDLRLACMLRVSYLKRSGIVTADGRKQPRGMTTTELIQSAGGERGNYLKLVLIELEKRKGDKVIHTLGAAMATKDKSVEKLAADLLLRHLNRQKDDVLKKCLKADRGEVRAASAYIVGMRNLFCVPELIALLKEDSQLVQQNARGALVRLSGGQDYGPEPNASIRTRDEAIAGWQDWWEVYSADKGKAK